METIPYEDFSLGLHQRVRGRRVPVNGTIEVTQRCPLACVHCYNNLPMSDQQALRGELSFEEHSRILDEIVEAGCLWLLYTGGEVFARGDFLDIYSYAKHKGLLLTLFTNGILIDERIADYLAKWRPFSIEITLYGRTRQTYEAVTSVPGSYERCMRGIRLLLERGLPLKLKTMVLSINRHEIWDMKRFAEDDLGLQFKLDATINPRLDCSQSPLDFRLSPTEVVALDLLDSNRATEWIRFCQRFGGPVQDLDRGNDLYQCGGGVNSFAIGPSGRLGVCALSCNDNYDLRQGAFRDGWEHFVRSVRQRKITRPSKCLACGIKAMCGMCPANGELESGDAEEPVDFLCEVAHLRAYALGLRLSPHGDCDYCPGGIKYEDLMESLTRILRIGETHHTVLEPGQNAVIL
jgi:radical SAM protein with 4Fe4S-binding SPASM domain